jgi:Flp pilus assembly protein TadD
MNDMQVRSFTVLGVLLLACACGKSAPEPETPPADSTDSAASEPVVAASSDAVKKGRDQIQAGDFAGAEATLGAAAKADPKDPQAAFYHGVALEGLERFEDSETEYRRAIELSPELLEAHVNLSFLLLSLDKPKEALAAADAGLAVDPKQPGLLANRAGALDVLGDAQALSAYEALLEVTPDDAANRYNYAVLLTVGERNADAVAALGKIQLAGLTDAGLLLDIAQLFGRLEAYGSCVQALDVAVSGKKTAELLAHRARCKHSAGDDKGAEADLRDAVQLEPDNPIGHYYLGKHLIAAGKKAEGQAALKKAVSLGPDTPFGKAAARDLKAK